jgi:DNA-binding response OmpR family regulator
MKKHTCIMVVDDEPGVCKLLKHCLEPEGYDVTTAPDGNAALALMGKCQPDLIILDIMMPGFDGFQALDIIRQRSNVPVIMLTGRGEMSTLRDALALGADDYVRKPFHTRELVARIRAKLRRATPALIVLEGSKGHG